MTKHYEVKRLPSGVLAIHQGEVYGLPVTFNPDDGRFYVHEPGDGGDVLGRFKDWLKAVQFAHRKSKDAKMQPPPAAPADRPRLEQSGDADHDQSPAEPGPQS